MRHLATIMKKRNSFEDHMINSSEM